MEHSKESEAVYVAQEDSHVVMSEKVQALAGSIYSEFERMINKYDESVVKELMPLVVNVLECLDLSYTENQEHEVELELLREDNEQLVTQYEREKHLRKHSDQKLLEIEDQTEEQFKQITSKNESLEAIVRMLELKAKNSSDHVNRLEDKENEMKKEYSKLHDRYTELFKTHMDYMERTKILMGTDRLENFGVTGMKKINLNNIMTRSAGPVSYGFASLEQNPSMLKSIASPDEFPYGSNNPPKLPSAANLQEEMSMEDAINESYNMSQNGEKNASVEDLPSKSRNKKEERSGNTLYQEFSFQEPELGDENAEITGNWVHPGEYASSDFGSEASCGSPTAKSPSNVNDNFFGMGKEVENLILENNELLATKNALNIVKDDLIAKVDELSSEHEILREEIQSLQAVKSRMKLRNQELEEEVKRMKEELEKKVAGKSDDEEDVPLAQRKRFTRVEMARVLMERNQYKERFMELQDAVRWTEMLRAAKHDPSLEKKNSRGIVSFFSSLFGKTTPPPVVLTTDRLVSSGGILTQGSPTKVPGGPVAASSSSASSSGRTEMSAEKLQLRRLGDPLQRKDQAAYKQIKAHVRKDDGRMQAYGWSLPAKSAGNQGSGALLGTNYSKETPVKGNKSSNGGTQGRHLPVPVPIYCRPFMEQTPGMKIFCASGVDLTGGRISEGESDGKYTSPHVWICTATHSASRVTIIDANRPADILQSFEVCSSHLLCISCVPGNKENDFQPEDGLINLDLKQRNDDTEMCAHLSRVTSEPIDESVKSEPCDTKIEPQKTEDTKTEENLTAVAGTGEGSRSSKDNSLTELNVTSAMPTMWLGAQSGFVMIHSAIGHWDTCLHKVRLPDSVLSITHLRGRTFVSMANGTVAIFLRGHDGLWDLSNYYLLDLENQPHHSIRCSSVVGEDIWCGFRNKVHVLDVYTLVVKKAFEAHPRKESQVRQMAWCGDGVWVSIRLDSTLRLYHAETHEHLQDVDIEPYVSKMLGTGKLGFSYARITALLVASHRLWVGTGNGVIISVPLQELAGLVNPTSGGSSSKGPGSALRIAHEQSEGGKEIPYCSMSQAQLSFHGHRDAVKFFVAVPGASSALPLTNEMDVKSPDIMPSSNSMLVISGGEGYIDFRVGENDDPEPKTAPDPNHPSEKAHIIIWQVATKV